MSAATPLRAPARSTPQRPPLRVVEPVTTPAGRIAFAILVGGILASGLVVLLMLHTLAAQDAFRLHDLQRRAAALNDAEQQLAVADQQAQAPSTLAARAKALGMVPTSSLRFTKRRNGEIVAVAVGVAPPPPAPKPAVTPSASAKATAPSSTKTSAKKATKPATKPATRPTRHTKHTPAHH